MVSSHIKPALILISLLFIFVFAIKAHSSESEFSANQGVGPSENNSPEEYEIYKPTYGILQFGTKNHKNKNSTTIKFQINLTKDVVSGKLFEIPTELNVAYTLKALWNVTDGSYLFEDYLHNPEIFVSLYKENWMNTFLGLEHESNGKTGVESRSWDRVYIQPRVLLRVSENAFDFHSLGIYLKAWYKFHDSKRNGNITDYQGYGELALKLYGDRHYFFVTHRRGGKIDIGTTILEYFLRLGNGWTLYAQYFDGYGEMPIDYDKKSRRFGIGFSILHF